MKTRFSITACVLMALMASQAYAVPIPNKAKPTLHAICMVESTGGKNKADGDHGKAIGPFQIHKEYWYDATHDKKGKQIFAGTYQDCRDEAYAEQIVILYFTRYCPKALADGDSKTMAYTPHRGDDNAEYYRRVQRFLK